MTTDASPLSPPADDELVTQILERRRRRTPFLTLALVVGVAAAAAFVGGVEVQKHYGSSGSASNSAQNSALSALAARFRAGAGGAARSGRSGFFGGFAGGGAGGLAGAGGGATSGTVTLIKGKDIYVTDSSGNTVLVHAATASVTKSVTGSVRSILPGETVTVIGAQARNGSYTARSITIGTSGGGGNG